MVTRRRLCLFSATVGVVLVIAATSVYMNRREMGGYHQPFSDDLAFEFGFPTSKPYQDFIDPDTKHFKRMFYNGDLVKRERSTTLASLKPNVRVVTTNFENPKHCVPFRVPGNLTSQICIYDPEEDRMISSYIRDNAAWEFDQVEIMAELMLADDKRRKMEENSHFISQDTKRTFQGAIHRLGTRNSINQGGTQNFNSQTHDAFLDVHDFLLPAQKTNTLTEDSVQQNHDASSVDKGAMAEQGLISVNKRPSANGQGLTSVYNRPSPEQDKGHLSTEMSLVDIGCNLGVYSLSAALLGHDVLAIDPVRDSLTLLATSLHLANLTSRATLLLNAISDQRGPVDVNVNPENVGGSSVAHRVLKNENDRNKKVKRPLKTRSKSDDRQRNRREIEQNQLGYERKTQVKQTDRLKQLSHQKSVQQDEGQLSGHVRDRLSRNVRRTQNSDSQNMLYRGRNSSGHSVGASVLNSNTSILREQDSEKLQQIPQKQNASTTDSETSEYERLSETVYAICLDDLIPYVRTRRVFLKLDIEGWEAKALRCASTFFQQLDVRYVLMEWLFHRKSRDGLAVIEFLTRNGFLPYDDVRKGTLLSPETYYSWPDNVLWGKR